jgi:acetolactate synthase-1/2/3 large subunit
MHHKLPIKIIVFANDGYAMIKGTHRNMKIPYVGVSKDSGVSMPDFSRVAAAFRMSACNVSTWKTLNNWLKLMFEFPDAFLMQINIDPEQAYVPRLQPIIEDGKITPARFDQLSPIQ